MVTCAPLSCSSSAATILPTRLGYAKYATPTISAITSKNTDSTDRRRHRPLRVNWPRRCRKTEAPVQSDPIFPRPPPIRRDARRDRPPHIISPPCTPLPTALRYADYRPPHPEFAMIEFKPTVTFDDFAKIDLRVAKVLAAEPHPNADRLLKLQIQIGEEQRQICAGIKQYYTPEEMVGKNIIVVANLAPRTIRGEVSNGMLLAATHKDGDEVRDVVLLAPGREVPPGSTVG
ncbi:MAG: methionine--tRNA ligase subunit beta [Phycisphaera sp.]|nr:methionine--tRNA ligase subunit beta [Phycisphaera sp.]